MCVTTFKHANKKADKALLTSGSELSSTSTATDVNTDADAVEEHSTAKRSVRPLKRFSPSPQQVRAVPKQKFAKLSDTQSKTLSTLTNLPPVPAELAGGSDSVTLPTGGQKQCLLMESGEPVINQVSEIDQSLSTESVGSEPGGPGSCASATRENYTPRRLGTPNAVSSLLHVGVKCTVAEYGYFNSYFIFLAISEQCVN